jgi:hypothetical protein
MAMEMTAFFCNVTLHGLIDRYIPVFARNILSSALKMEMVCFSETLVSTYVST